MIIELVIMLSIIGALTLFGIGGFVYAWISIVKRNKLDDELIKEIKAAADRLWKA